MINTTNMLVDETYSERISAMACNFPNFRKRSNAIKECQFLLSEAQGRRGTASVNRINASYVSTLAIIGVCIYVSVLFDSDASDDGAGTVSGDVVSFRFQNVQNVLSTIKEMHLKLHVTNKHIKNISVLPLENRLRVGKPSGTAGGAFDCCLWLL